MHFIWQLETITSCRYKYGISSDPGHDTKGHSLVIKTHGSVSCGPRSRRATPVSILTGRTKTSFSHLCISVITYLIGTEFATQLPASQGSLHSKFEGNRSSQFRDTSCQSLVFFSSFFLSSSSFRTLAKIAITTNAYSDCLEIWQTERESNGES